MYCNNCEFPYEEYDTRCQNCGTNFSSPASQWEPDDYSYFEDDALNLENSENSLQRAEEVMDTTPVPVQSSHLDQNQPQFVYHSRLNNQNVRQIENYERITQINVELIVAGVVLGILAVLIGIFIANWFWISLLKALAN